MSGPPSAMTDAESSRPRQIAGFWRRIAAAAIDSILLGAFGACLGLVWFAQLALLGSSGRLLGGAIALAYLSILNSGIGRGQTLGKRVVGIRVVDDELRAIGLPRSVLRSLVLLVPVTLNGFYPDSPEPASPLLVALAFCVIGLGGSLVYLYVFNRRTRQSLHDLLAGTFVVDARASGAVRQRLWRPHLALVAGWLVVVVVGIAPLGKLLAGAGPYRGLLELQQEVQAVVPGARVVVERGTTTMATLRGERSSTPFFGIEVYAPVEPDSYEDLADRIAGTTLKAHPDVRSVAEVSISISFGYDILISSMHTQRTFSRSPQEWDERLRLRSEAGSST